MLETLRQVEEDRGVFFGLKPIVRETTTLWTHPTVVTEERREKKRTVGPDQYFRQSFDDYLLRLVPPHSLGPWIESQT